MKYNNNLRAFREDHDKTQKQIATILGILQEQYSRYELGYRQMPIEYYKILSIIFDVSIDYLCAARTQPCTLSRMPYKVSKHYQINQKGNIENTFK